jgi:hypothetical protein
MVFPKCHSPRRNSLWRRRGRPFLKLRGAFAPSYGESGRVQARNFCRPEPAWMSVAWKALGQMRRRYPVEIALSRCHESTRAGSKPFCNSAMVGACPSAALAEAVTSVATLGGSSLRRCRAVLGTLYCFAPAVNIRSVVGTFRLKFLLLLRCRLRRRRLRNLREERS